MLYQDELNSLASRARAELERVSKPDQPLTMLVSQDNEQHELVLPAEAVKLMMDVLEQLSLNKTVSVVAADKMMTTQEAASFLRVSRPFITKLLKAEKIPFQQVGTHRRIRFADLQNYKTKTDSLRERSLDEIAEIGQDIGIGY